MTALIYAGPVLLILAVYLWRRRRVSFEVRQRFEQAEQQGLNEPASLHPEIDPARCMGCAACVKACPEGDVLGVAEGRARLVAGSNCIGHGACQRACPFDAIDLVFGTERRGMEIPAVDPRFESSVPGLYIAGELGGMGLVANAVEQGCQAVSNIAASLERGRPDGNHDLIIVGAGPAGIAASLKARQLGLRCITLEQDSLGGTVSHFPRHKIVMTRPVHLPLYGKLKLRRIDKDQLIEVWRKVIEDTGVEPVFRCRVEQITPRREGFEVTCENGDRYQASRVLLTIGRRGTPRKLDVEGEQSNKVLYRLTDPEQYAHSRCLVVGGGDSAVECALRLSGQPGTRVTLSYRGDSLSRAKAENRQQFDDAIKAGKICVIWNSTVQKIGPSVVTLTTSDGPVEIENDFVLVNAGGILPTGFLKQIGVAVERWHGNRRLSV